MLINTVKYSNYYDKIIVNKIIKIRKINKKIINKYYVI